MKKFEKRRADLIQKHEVELRNLLEAQAREISKKVDPVAKKIGAIAEEEARRIFEQSPEILDDFTFRKRDSARVIHEALLVLFSEVGSQEESQDLVQNRVDPVKISETKTDPESDTGPDPSAS